MPFARRAITAWEASVAVWPLSRRWRMVSLTDSKAETTKAQPASASSARASGWRRMCSTLMVASKVRSGWRRWMAATTRPEWWGR
jgi:hypothetical protein